MLPKLGEVLKAAGVIDEYQLATALAEQDRWGHRLGVTLIKLGFVEEDALVRALSQQMRLPMATLEGRQISWEALQRIPAEVAEQTMTLPLHLENENGTEVLYLGVEDPTNVAVLDDLRFRAGTEVRPVLVAPSELAEGIDRYYRTCGHMDSESAQPMSSGIVGHDSVSVEFSSGARTGPTDEEAPVFELRPETADLRSPGKSSEDTDVLDPTPVLETIDALGASQPELLSEEELVFAQPIPERSSSLATPETPAPKAPESKESATGESTRRILQAVTQLLVEAELIDRDALRKRVAALEARDAQRRSTS